MSIWRPAWGPLTFDPVRLGHQETTAWASYYRHDWFTFLRAAVGMVRTGFGTDPVRTVVGAYHVLRANQLWAPYPDNDADGARASMRRFYALVNRHLGLSLDPVRASELEVEWWRVHRAHQGGQESFEALVEALVAVYAYVYGAEPAELRRAAELRAEAMDVSDAWVAAGRDPDDPQLARERALLVRSYAALLAAIHQ